MITVLFMVVSLAQMPAANEALGRCYAADQGVPYPVPGTPFWQEPIPSSDESQYAFAGDPLTLSCLGQTFETSYGPITLPEQAEELDCPWFLQICDWRHGCISAWYQCNE